MGSPTARLAGIVRHVVLRPRLWRAAVRAAWRFRARGWYRRPPFLPLPPPEYLAWRLYTAYGDENAVPPARDFERYLRWVDRSMGPRRREAGTEA